MAKPPLLKLMDGDPAPAFTARTHDGVWFTVTPDAPAAEVLAALGD